MGTIKSHSIHTAYHMSQGDSICWPRLERAGTSNIVNIHNRTKKIPRDCTFTVKFDLALTVELHGLLGRTSHMTLPNHKGPGRGCLSFD